MERVAFEIFGVPIYWYGIIITSAIVLDFFILCKTLKKREGSSDLAIDLLLCLVPLGIVGARLFSVIFEPGLTILDFFKFRDGGMSIIGGVIGGSLGLGLFCLIKKRNFFEMADYIAPLLILSQGIGRWGNFFNGEVFGKEIVDPSLQWFPLAVMEGGRYYMALFFYESMLDLIGFALLISLFFIKKRKAGILTATYLCYYGALRFFMEGLREEEYILRWGNVPVSKLFSGLMVLAGVAIFAYIVIKKIIDDKRTMVENNGKEKTNTI